MSSERTMKKRKVFLSYNDPGVANMFRAKGYDVTYILDGSVDMAVWVGGEDIHPYLYGQLPISNKEIYDLDRDMREVALYKSLIFRHVPKVGICRGAQLLNVLAGGSLYQDVDGHRHPHKAAPLNTPDGTSFLVSSTHHQQMIPGPTADVLLVANESTSKKGNSHRDIPILDVVIPKDNEDCVYDWDDVEAVYYDHNNTLCFQPHPEFATMGKCQEYFFYLLETYSWTTYDEYYERIRKMKEAQDKKKKGT